MADSVEGEAGFWLPSQFLDDFLDDKENLNDNSTQLPASEFYFPNEFPFDFEATVKDEHFEKGRRVMSTSPQSTLAHLWTSPPMTPPAAARNDDVGDLAYRVAKLKLSGPGAQLHASARTRSPSVFHNVHLQQQQGHGRGMWYGQSRAAGQDPWVVHQNPIRMVGPGRRAAMFGGGSGSGVKRECAGTGVFLPRRYENNSNNDCNNASYSSAAARKTPGYAAITVPNQNDRYAHRLNFNPMNGFAQPKPNFPPKFNTGYVSDYDLLVARRNALLLQHQCHRLQLQSLLLEGSSPASRGTYLP